LSSQKTELSAAKQHCFRAHMKNNAARFWQMREETGQCARVPMEPNALTDADD
jgi:hypothetical protein